MKCLVMIRASTEAQQIEDQHNEMVKFCTEEGYDELVFVEDKGASAIKLNDQYRLMIEQVKEEIEKDPTINCFAVWELSRAFRNEGVYYEVKTFLLNHNVQFICKNPYLKLLNPDGSLNSGMEIAMSLLATLAKQEMELKKERFHRAKKSMFSQGRYIGGAYIKYGYKVGEGGYFEINEEEAPVIRLMYEMYSTGQWSSRTLYDELRERGYNVTYHRIIRCLSDRSYVDGVYPQLISNELWEKCRKIRERNMLSIPKGRQYYFGCGIFKCSVCGRSMVVCGDQYRCWHHNRLSAPPHCDNGLTIRVDNMDGLLWWVTSKEEVSYRMRMDADKKKEYEKEIGVLRQKVESARKKLAQLDDKQARIKELYIEGVIDKKEYKNRSNRTLSEAKESSNTILSLNEKIEGFLTLLQGDDESHPDLDRLVEIYGGVYSESDLKIMNEIVKKHIKRVTTSAEWFGKERDKRAVRQNAQLVTIETKNSGVKKFIYVARAYKKHRFWWYTDDGSEKPLLSVKKIERKPIGSLDPKAFKKIKDW